MARPLRIEYKGVFYHTTSRGNERRRICFVLIQGLTPFFLQGLEAGHKRWRRNQYRTMGTSGDVSCQKNRR